MDKKPLNKLLIAAATCTTTQSLQSNGSATGNPRNKCALKPGHSLMDWIRLGNSGADLSGTGGRLIPVSKEELAKHNNIKDAWMAIRGVVYNVTQYIEFHPGGVEELMRGVGTDATKLFNDTHAWVNFAQLLNKCRIGPLTNTVKLDANIERSLTLPTKSPFEKPPRPMQQADILPRLDWIQTRDNITLYFYTKQFCNPGSIIRNLSDEDRNIEIWIFIDLYVHKFNLELQRRIKWPPKSTQISSDIGKIEVKFKKHDDHINLWNDLGKYKKSKLLVSKIELDTYMEFEILAKNKFSNDSFYMLLKNNNTIYAFPVGYHLTIEHFVNEKKIYKCYTPVPKKYVNKYMNVEIDMDCLYFLIKHYTNPDSFSQHLYNLEHNSKLKISLPRGKLKLSTLTTHTKFCFLAAGSGLTPFLGVTDHLLNRNINRM